MASLQGHLLIASPNLPDPNFFRSVVLIIEHDDAGAFGLILNRTTYRHLSEFLDEDNFSEDARNVRLAVGGPVEGPFLVLHSSPEFGDPEIVPGVYLGRSSNSLCEMIQQKGYPFRAFVGYSGWGEGQLDIELESGSWLTLPATSEHVFELDEEDVWEQAVMSVGTQKTKDFFKIHHVADDPSWN